MSAGHAEGHKVGGTGGTESLRGRLEHFGDPHQTQDWHTGEVDYVAQLGLTAADVPELLAIARQWAEPFDWPEDENDVSGYAPVHAWRGLARLGATEAIGPLLEMLEPLEESEDDWYLDEFPHAFAWIGPASLAPLRDYLMDERHGTSPRMAAAGGLRELAKRHGQFRADVVKALCDALSRFEQADPTFNGLIVADLLDLKATDAAELIERAHAADCVDITVCGNWETVRKRLGVQGLGLVPEHLATKRPLWLPSPEVQAKLEAAAELLRGQPLAPGDDLDDLADSWADPPVLPLQPAREGGAQRPVPVRQRQEVQEMLLAVTGPRPGRLLERRSG